jgi:hypothetical protein
MRILTLVAGEGSVAEAAGLLEQIRTFNACIDFRLRFLHMEIEQVHAVPAGQGEEIRRRAERAEVHEIPPEPPLEAAARLALLLQKERPQVLVIAGAGPLLEPGLAAARVAGTPVAVYGTGREVRDGVLDLGADPNRALEGLTGVVREVKT